MYNAHRGSDLETVSLSRSPLQDTWSSTRVTHCAITTSIRALNFDPCNICYTTRVRAVDPWLKTFAKIKVTRKPFAFTVDEKKNNKLSYVRAFNTTPQDYPRRRDWTPAQRNAFWEVWRQKRELSQALAGYHLVGIYNRLFCGKGGRGKRKGEQIFRCLSLLGRPDTQAIHSQWRIQTFRYGRTVIQTLR